MNCIDAIEGIIKRIIDRTLEDLFSDRLDDTEYIRNIKTVIFAAEAFMRENKEIFNNPEIVKRILYDYAKDKWMNHRVKPQHKNKTTTYKADNLFDLEYLYYYYDYIYDRGVYPL